MLDNKPTGLYYVFHEQEIGNRLDPPQPGNAVQLIKETIMSFAKNTKATLSVIALSFAAAGLAYADDNGRADELGQVIAEKTQTAVHATPAVQAKSTNRDQVKFSRADGGRPDELGQVIAAKNQGFVQDNAALAATRHTDVHSQGTN
jgi:hypothetical protein